jgi:hypothetical protein
MAGFERQFQQLKESDMPKGVYERKSTAEAIAEDRNIREEQAIASQVMSGFSGNIGGGAAFIDRRNSEEYDALQAQLAKELAEVRALRATLEMQTTVRAEVSEALRLQEQETRRQAFGKITPSDAEPMPPKPDEKLVTIRLDRNYRPMGYFEIAGWHKEEVRRKNAAGREVVVEAAEFIKGERKPPAIPGTGFANKYWAGQVLRVPASEAAIIRERRIGSIELD